ncbi:MAG: glycosyltransferase family 39 protein [Proteobacteria bacterium]|nr:glycosyltransferase family 39 protein [Pseudomonadota bacterium]
MTTSEKHKGLVLLLLASFGLHSIVALIPPLNGDEATFWEWSRHLALGYYAHPPMTAWLVALTTNLFGVFKYNVRLPAILLHLGTIIFVYRLTLDLFKSQKPAFYSALLYAALPISMVLGTAMTTDAGLVFFFTAAVYYSKLAVIDDKRRSWYMVGLTGGAMLLTKFMAVLFFPGLFLFLLINGRYRKVFLTKEPYLGSLTALLLFSPFLYWNYQNSWLTFQFNFFMRHREEGFDPVKPIKYLAGQLLAGSPLVFSLLLAALVVFLFRLHRKRSRATQKKDDTVLLLSYFTAFPLVYFAGTSLGVEVAPHWPAIVYGPGVVLLVAWLYKKPSFVTKTPTFQSGLYWSSFSLSLVISALLSFLVLFPKVLPDNMIYTENVYEEAPVLSHYFGWKEAGRHIDTIIKEWEGRPEGLFMTSKDYSLASMLGFYTPSHPNYYLMNVTKDVVHGKSYLLWEKGKKKLGANTIYVGDEPDSYKKRIPEFFEETRQLDPLIVRDKDGRILRIFYITLGLGYLGGEPDNLSLW